MVASDGFDITLDRELRQQRQRRARRQSLLDGVERIFVIERGSHEDDITLRCAARMRQDAAAPVLSVMCKQDALRPARRTGGVALDCDGIRIRLDGVKRSVVEKGFKAVRAPTTQLHHTHSRRNETFRLGLGEHQARRRIGKNIGNRVC